ncbi:ribonuclease H-like domain-containing protein [Tanacetum coccineum]
MSKVLQERGFGSLPRSTKVNPRDHIKSIASTVDADTQPIHHIRLGRYTVSNTHNSKMIFIPNQTTIPFPSHLYGFHFDEEKESYELKNVDAYRTILRNDSLPQKEKDPRSFTLPCYINNTCFKKSLADLGASISAIPYSTYISLGLGKLDHTKLTVELADQIMKHPICIAENVLVGIGKICLPRILYKSRYARGCQSALDPRKIIFVYGPH